MSFNEKIQSPYPVRPVSGPSPVQDVPLGTALGNPGGVFKTPTVGPIPQGGTFTLEIPVGKVE